jgi:hypothetical protein
MGRSTGRSSRRQGPSPPWRSGLAARGAEALPKAPTPFPLPRFRTPGEAARPGPNPGQPGTGSFPVKPEDRPIASAGPGPHILRYGGRSGQLPPGALARAESIVRSASIDKQPELLVWIPALRVSPAGTTVFARLQAQADDLRDLAVEIATSADQTAPTRFSQMKQTGGVLEWSARYLPAPGPGRMGTGVHTPPPLAIRYLVRASGRFAGVPFTRTAGGLFYLHRPGGRLQAARTEVTRREGDLVVTTSAVIERPGTYWAYAELWGGIDGNRPIAFARERLTDLRTGRHKVELRFGGLIVRDSGVDGPYLIRNLQFKQVDTHPPHEADPVAALPATPPWPATDFR